MPGIPPGAISRRYSVVNSSSLSSAISFSGSTVCRVSSSTAGSPARSSSSATSSRTSRSCASWSRSAAMILSLPRTFTSSRRAISSSSEPNIWSSCAAVFGPTPGIPGRLSLESPTSASKSPSCLGGTPHFSTTSASPNSLPRPSSFIVSSSAIAPSRHSCIRSLSDETITTCSPLRSARRASVAITSSASASRACRQTTPIAVTSCDARSNCGTSSTGHSPRFCL
jgi:hypothetical protein